MSTRRAAVADAGRDVAVAVFAGSLVFALIFGIGRLSIAPQWLPSPGAVASATGVAQDGGGVNVPNADVAGLRAIVDDMFGFGAAASVTGAIDDQLVFGQVDHFKIEPTYSCLGDDCNSSPTPPTEGPPIRLSIAYVGDKIKLAVIARVPDVGSPFTEGATPVLTIGAQSFIAHSGECTMTLSSLAFTGDVGRFADQGTDIAGQMTCTDVADQRSGDTVSYTAVFVLRTTQGVPP